MNKKNFLFSSVQTIVCTLFIISQTSCNNKIIEIEDLQFDNHIETATFNSIEDFSVMNSTLTYFNNKFYLVYNKNESFSYIGNNDSIIVLSQDVFENINVKNEFIKLQFIDDKIIYFNDIFKRLYVFNSFTKERVYYDVSELFSNKNVLGFYQNLFSKSNIWNNNFIIPLDLKDYSANSHKGKTNLLVFNTINNNSFFLGKYPKEFSVNDFRNVAIYFDGYEKNEFIVSFAKSSTIFRYQISGNDTIVNEYKLKPDYTFKSLSYNNTPTRKEEIVAANQSATLRDLKIINEKYAARFAFNNPENRTELLIYKTSDWSLIKRYKTEFVYPQVFVFDNQLYLIALRDEKIKVFRYNFED